MLPINELWDRRFLSLAKEIATWSKDPSTQVGAVLVNKWRRVISTGYNGLPANLPDSPAKLLDRNYKIENMIHAEINCLNNLSDDPMEIMNGILTVRLHELIDIAPECTLFVWPLLPCPTCAKILVYSGVCRIVSKLPTYELEKRWNLNESRMIFMHHDIPFEEYYVQ